MRRPWPRAARGAETPYRIPPGGLRADRLVFSDGLTTWRPRGTPDCLMLVTVGGRGRVGHERGEVVVERGHIVVLLPHAPHDYGVTGRDRWSTVWAHFAPTPERLDLLRWPELSPGIRWLRGDDDAAFAEIVAVMERAALRFRSTRPHALALAANAIEEALLLCDALNPERGALDRRVRAVIDHVGAALHRPLRLADAARVAGLSVSRLARLFRAQVGASVQEYVEAQRIALARHRLALTDEPIGRIAESLGFANPFYFTRRFALHVGMSPRAFRRKARG